MKRLPALLLMCLLLNDLALAQGNIRNPTINTETEQGDLISQAGQAEDDATRMQLLETFVQKYSDHDTIGYVYLQLQNLHLAAGNFDKVIEYGKKLLATVPGDVEIRHNLTKAYEAKQNFDALLPHLIETKPLAEKETQLPEPEFVDEVEGWQARLDYSKGVIQYIEYSLYTSTLKITDPAKKIEYMDALKKHYPEGQYAKTLDDMYVQVYQQLGDAEKMLTAMEAAIQANPANEYYLFTLAESGARQAQYGKSKGYAEQLVQAMAQKSKPDNMTEEDWVKHKALFTAYGDYILGKLTVLQAGEDKQAYRDARKALLDIVDPIKEQGGEHYGILAYMLGICYVKLDIGGDNIAQATNWMNVSAKEAHPYQGEAQKTLGAIRQATQ
ncbi:MAG: hypothetical protein O2968_13170 [Acidobacteria bacterium]|nr:hypothetical protein [Acidobacteriota bacterium]